MSQDLRDATLKTVYTLWLNNYLRTNNIVIQDIYTDFKDGKTLPLLIETLYDEKIKWNQKCASEFISLNNIRNAVTFFERIGVVNNRVQISAEDFCNNQPSNHKKILSFFGSLINNYAIEPITYKGNVGKNGLKKWVQDNSKDYEIKNWGSSWENDKAFYAIMNHFYPNAFEIDSPKNQQLLQFTNQSNECSTDENVNVVIASELFYFFANINEYVRPDAKIKNLLLKRGNSFLWSHIKVQNIAFREPEMIQASIRNEENVNGIKRIKSYKLNENDVTRKLKALGPDQVMLITFVGSYQTGKSSTIKRLTMFQGVQIGNGRKDETRGAVLYGPFSYNKIREEFGLGKTQKDINIMFVDTEGANGFFENNEFDVATNLIVNLLTPFASVSDIIITMNKTKVTQPETVPIRELLKAIKTIRSDWKDIDFVNVFTDYPGYNPLIKETIKQSFENAKEETPLKLPDMTYTDTIPLVCFDNKNNADVFQQGPEFQEGFKIFAHKLISLIEKRKNKFIIDGYSMASMFLNLSTNEIITDFAKIAQEISKSRSGGVSLTYERIYERTCTKIIAEEINDMILFYDQYKKDLDEGKEHSAIDFKVEERVQRVISRLNEKIPESMHNVEEFQKFEQSIHDQIETTANKYIKKDGPAIKKIQERYVCEMIVSYINKSYNIIESDMEATNGQKIHEVYDSKTPDILKKACDREFNRIREKTAFDKEVIILIEQKMQLSIDDIVEKIRKKAEEIAKRNRKDASLWKIIKHDVKEFFCGKQKRKSVITVEMLEERLHTK